jgi:hypothetical protein
MDDLTLLPWRTSTYSGGNGGGCVEVTDNTRGQVLVRDSKDRDGGVLMVPAAAWRAFGTDVKRRGSAAVRSA